jgi:16S rRNA (guanine966-N2)-methyltransferase
MRVSGGELRSREIRSPLGRAIRPTPGRVKEALFSIVSDRIDGATVLDLYAGTGAIGFEALSRGASHATFVERHAPSAAAIRAAAKELGVAERSTIVCAPAERAARSLNGRYDFVFADPPYDDAPPAAAFEALRSRGLVHRDSLLVYEHRSGAPVMNAVGFSGVRSAVYGEVALQFLAVDE